MHDYWGREWSRAFQLETLASAIEGCARRKQDRFIAASIQHQLGPSPLVSAQFELVQESRHQLIFRIRAVNSRKKRGSFRLVTAKNHTEFSRVTVREFRHLQWLYERIPNLVVEPLKGERIFLPDRHKRKEKGRTLFAYVTRWPTGFQELGIRRDLRFTKNVDTPVTFDQDIDEAIKRRIVEIIIRTYDARQHTCIELPRVTSGDFVVAHQGSGQPRLKLVSCRRLITNATPERLLHSVLTGSWKWGDREFNIVPSDPADVVQALNNALGKAEAKMWFDRYRTALARRRFRDAPAMPLQQLMPFFE